MDNSLLATVHRLHRAGDDGGARLGTYVPSWPSLAYARFWPAIMLGIGHVSCSVLAILTPTDERRSCSHGSSSRWSHHPPGWPHALTQLPENADSAAANPYYC